MVSHQAIDNEKADARFTRVATKRVNRALDTIRRLGKMSNMVAYRFDPANVEKMFAALRSEVDLAEARYLHNGGGQKSFSFQTTEDNNNAQHERSERTSERGTVYTGGN